MIIALKTRKLRIKIAIGEARTGGEGGGVGGGGGRCGSFLVACNLFFFGFYLHVFFPRVFPLACVLQPPLVVSKFFSRGIYMDRLFFLFPRSLINIPSGVYYKAQWLLFLQNIMCS